MPNRVFPLLWRKNSAGEDLMDGRADRDPPSERHTITKPSLFQDCLQSVGVAPKASAEDLIVFTSTLHHTHHIVWVLSLIFGIGLVSPLSL